MVPNSHDFTSHLAQIKLNSIFPLQLLNNVSSKNTHNSTQAQKIKAHLKAA